MVKELTWKHIAGATVGSAIGATAGLTIGGLIIAEALTAPVSLPFLGGILGAYKSENKTFNGRVRSGIKQSAFSFVTIPITAPLCLVSAPITAVCLTGFGGLTGFLLVEDKLTEIENTKRFKEQLDRASKENLDRLEKNRELIAKYG